MNILAQLLPGVRDLRTPFAVGVLWVLAGVLLEPQVPIAFREQVKATVQVYSRPFQLLPDAVHVPLLALGIYILGVIFSYLGDSLIRVLGLLVDLRSFILAAAFAISIVAPGVLIAVGAVLAGFFFLIVLLAWKPTRDRAIQIADPVERLLSDLRESFLPAVVELLDTFTSGWSSERRERRLFVKEDTARRVLSSPFMLRGLLGTLSDRNLGNAQIELQIELDVAELGKWLDQKGASWRKGPRQRQDALPDLEWYDYRATKDDEFFIDNGSSWRSLLGGRGVSSSLRGYLREYMVEKLGARMAGDQEAERRFIWRYTEVRIPARDLDQRINELHVRLKVDQPTLYDEYDRLRAEGEFRSAIALPVTAAWIAAGYALARHISWIANNAPFRWVNDVVIPWLAQRLDVDFNFAIPVTSLWPVWVSGTLPLLLFVTAGRVKTVDSARLLYASIRQQLVKNADSSLFRDLDVKTITPTIFTPKPSEL